MEPGGLVVDKPLTILGAGSDRTRFDAVSQGPFDQPLPLFVVALYDRWATFPEGRGVKGAVPAFGTEAAARKSVKRLAKRYQKPESVFRIVEYRMSGKVMEG